MRILSLSKNGRGDSILKAAKIMIKEGISMSRNIEKVLILPRSS
jgi:hypothetical protein